MNKECRTSTVLRTTGNLNVLHEAFLCAEDQLAQEQYNTDPEFRAAVQRLTDTTIDQYATVRRVGRPKLP